MSNREYSVYQFFPGGDYERYKEWVTMEEAVKGFKFLTTNVSSRMGFTERVIITDGGDCTIAEWKYGLGLIWPIPSDQWFGGWK
jgi:hypothetical protein